MRFRSSAQIRSTFVLALLLLGACAKGTPRGLADSAASGSSDGGIADAEAGAYSWPDSGGLDGFAGWPDLSSELPDAGPPDGDPGRLDGGSDGSVSCSDPNEPNGTCAVAKSVGSTKEGTSWLSKSAPLDPSTDVDWYIAKGLEGKHFCIPFTSQCYKLTVKLKVPTGRRMRLCLWKAVCSGTSYCVDNATSGSAQVETSYKVKGTCSLNDDTTAYIRIDNKGSSGGCSDYTVEINYNKC